VSLRARVPTRRVCCLSLCAGRSRIWCPACVRAAPPPDANSTLLTSRCAISFAKNPSNRGLIVKVGNPAHVAAAREMGVAVVTLPDGRLQLLHTVAQARSAADAEEGLAFMHEMLELSKAQAQADSAPLAVSYRSHAHRVRLAAGPAHFGRVLRGTQRVAARVALAEPLRACAPLSQPHHLEGRIAVIERGDCMFIDKVRKLDIRSLVTQFLCARQFLT